MKKIIFTITLALFVLSVYGQTPKKDLMDNDYVFDLIHDDDKGVKITYKNFIDLINEKELNIKCVRLDDRKTWDLYIKDEPIKVPSNCEIIYYKSSNELFINSLDEKLPMKIMINWIVNNNYITYYVSTI